MIKYLATAAVCAITTPEQMFYCMQNYIAQLTTAAPTASAEMDFRNPSSEWLIKKPSQPVKTKASSSGINEKLIL